MMYTAKFSDISLESCKKYGMKTARLALLMKEGFLVPDGFGLSADALEDYLIHNNIHYSKDVNEKQIEKCICQGSFQDKLMEELRSVWNFFNDGDASLIVRSSALEEDGDDSSFAGMFESIINVRSFEDMLWAVKKCWLSYYAAHLQAYRTKNGLVSTKMALAIQKMVCGEKSGVTFTINPKTMNKDEIVIEACYGLNTSVVDNLTSADFFIYHKDMYVKDRVIANKKTFYVLNDRSLKISVNKIDSIHMESPVLSEKELRYIAEIALRIERLCGWPCDIEWSLHEGKLYILQTRPVVTGRLDIHDKIYYNNDISKDAECSLLDRYSEPAATCYLSLIESWEEKVYFSFYYKKIGKDYHRSKRPLLFFFNRIYWNSKYQKEFFDDNPLGEKGIKKSFKKMKLMRLMLFSYKNWYKRLPFYEAKVKEFYQSINDQMTVIEVEGLLKRVICFFYSYIGIDHFRFLGLAQVCYASLLSLFNNKEKGKELIANYLETNVSDNMTVRSNNELNDLANEIGKKETLLEIFKNFDSKDIYRELKKKDEVEFINRFEKFLNAHGHRGTSCDDICFPHWIEEPEIVLNILKQFINFPAKIHMVKKSDDIKGKTNEIFEDSLDFNTIPKRLLAGVLMKLTAVYMSLRENQRYYFDKSWLVIRKLLLCAGRIFCGSGILDSEYDVFHLTINEVYQLCSAGSINQNTNWKELVAVRKKILKANKSIIPPYLIKNGELIWLQKKGSHKSYKAVGISPGKALGHVKTIFSVEDIGKVTHGDIIIVPTFHPSWTPVLEIASGMIMNYGNILSHGAVVAREYGIPVVVFNDDAAGVFENGQYISIDGTKGRIHILEPDGDQDAGKGAD